MASRAAAIFVLNFLGGGFSRKILLFFFKKGFFCKNEKKNCFFSLSLPRALTIYTS